MSLGTALNVLPSAYVFHLSVFCVTHMLKVFEVMKSVLTIVLTISEVWTQTTFLCLLHLPPELEEILLLTAVRFRPRLLICVAISFSLKACVLIRSFTCASVLKTSALFSIPWEFLGFVFKRRGI